VAAFVNERRRIKKPLRLVDSKVVGDGVTILIYEPAGRSSG
jgi:hypothetical protein